jgi:hypothetical protein
MINTVAHTLSIFVDGSKYKVKMKFDPHKLT